MTNQVRMPVFDPPIQFESAIKSRGSNESQTEILGGAHAIPSGYPLYNRHRTGRHTGIYPVAALGPGGFTTGPGCEDSARPT
jgi:hypothetical protein